MSDWIEHNGGPQPVDDDVCVEVSWSSPYPFDATDRADRIPWEGGSFRYRILNQHLIDAKQAEIDALRDDLETWQSVFPHVMPDRLKSDQQLAEEDVAAKIDAARHEGIRLGLEAAVKEIAEREEAASNCPDGGSEWLRTDHMKADIRNLNPDTIAKETQHD